MKRTACATVALLSALALQGHAQPIQPVYLQYDGFVRNKDNHTITLSFGYYNMNHVDVRIAVGDANGFLPGPAGSQSAADSSRRTPSFRVRDRRPRQLRRQTAMAGQVRRPARRPRPRRS